MSARLMMIRHWHLRNGHKPRDGQDYCEGCAHEMDDLLKHMDAAGFTVVRKEPMTEDIKELVKRLREERKLTWKDCNEAAIALEALAGEVAEALPWKLFYKDGLDLEQIGKRLGTSPYDYSPWLYAPLISQLKDREKTALADSVAEVARLKTEIERNARNCIDTMNKMGAEAASLRAERDRLKAALQDCVDAYDFVIVNEYDRGWSSVSDAIHAARKALGDAS